MKKPLLCWIGWHKWQCVDRWVPSIHAKIVTEFHQTVRCCHCSKERKDLETHLYMGKDF